MGGVAAQLLDLTLVDDRLTYHGADGPVVIPLPYQIHARLIQTSELARLLAERVREEDDAQLPPAGSRVRILVPLEWGLVCLRLPMADIEELAQPAHHLLWEVDTNAPESGGQYLFDIKAATGDSGESLLLAVRSGLFRFCESFCEELGWKLDRMAPAEDELGEFELDGERARDWLERLKEERFPRRFSWKPLLYAAASVGVLALALLLPWRGTSPQPESPGSPQAPALGELEELQQVEPLQPEERAHTADAQPDQSPEEPTATPREDVSSGTIQEAASSPPATSPSTAPPSGAPLRNSSGLLVAWKDLLASLAAHEDRLPDFLAIDNGGILVRREGLPGLPLADLLGRAARVSKVGTESWWIHFDQPLYPSPPGKRQLGREDAGRPTTSFELATLGELETRLGAAPYRLILQRRRQADAAGAGLQWALGEDAGLDPGIGWRVKSFPLAGPLGHSAD